MPQLPSLLELLKAGVHFGHQQEHWHPKMKPYLYTSRQGVHIIDLEKTQSKLKEALDFITNIVVNNGVVLFTSLKVQSDEIVKQAAQEASMPYMIGRWLGGVFTNFPIVYKLINKLETMEKELASGGWEKYSKKERLDLDKELKDLEALVGGIRTMTKIPQAVFLIGLREGKNALAEAKKVGVPVVALADSNTNPNKVEYPIPANDDAIKGLQLITKLVVEAIKEGKQKAERNKV